MTKAARQNALMTTSLWKVPTRSLDQGQPLGHHAEQALQTWRGLSSHICGSRLVVREVLTAPKARGSGVGWVSFVLLLLLFYIVLFICISSCRVSFCVVVFCFVCLLLLLFGTVLLCFVSLCFVWLWFVSCFVSFSVGLCCFGLVCFGLLVYFVLLCFIVYNCVYVCFVPFYCVLFRCGSCFVLICLG